MALMIGFNLMDRQILDRDGALVGKVDDVELTVGADGVPVVTALLVGQEALGERIGGAVGALMAGMARRLQDERPTGPTRVPYDLVDDVGSAITLSVPLDRLPTPPLEDWLCAHLITGIPGADHAGH